MPKQDSKLTARQAVERVLRSKRRMTVGQITEAALPLTALKGKTPKQTFSASSTAKRRRPKGSS